MPWTRSAAYLALLASFTTAACGPRVVTDIALSPTFAKVTYVKRSFLFPETGIVECQRAEDGSLSNCKKLNVTFRKPE
jgi:hypothetical protein